MLIPGIKIPGTVYYLFSRSGDSICDTLLLKPENKWGF